MAERRGERMIEAINIKTLPVDMPPSHFCAICGKMEYDNAVYCTSAFWLCDKCIGKLKKILEEVKE